MACLVLTKVRKSIVLWFDLCFREQNYNVRYLSMTKIKRRLYLSSKQLFCAPKSMGRFDDDYNVFFAYFMHPVYFINHHLTQT